jgi:hypothetical protein
LAAAAPASHDESPVPALRAASRTLDAEIYLRQERTGVLLGVYEKDATPWAVMGTPWEYGDTELLPPNLDRLEKALAKGFQRFPSLPEAGIRRRYGRLRLTHW